MIDKLRKFLERNNYRIHNLHKVLGAFITGMGILDINISQESFHRVISIDQKAQLGFLIAISYIVFYILYMLFDLDFNGKKNNI